MSSLVIVAIPAEDDYINKISSEKIPHMTLLFLGDDVSKVKNLSKILDYVGHAASQTLERFGLEVDHRGKLGPESADVVFFSKDKWSGYEAIRDFRSYLLKENNIRTAYDSATQFPEWVPHLTLGFTDTPAKPDNRDFPGINYVNFDRIAVWFGDYEGIEFPLKRHNWDSEVTMSSTRNVVDDILTHHGVKGMKWGVRRERSSSVTVSDKRKKIKTSGGSGHPAHPDAVRARTFGQVGKKSGLKALSNQELQTYASRLQLEQNVKRLNYNDMSRGKKFVANLTGKNANRAVETGLKTGGAAALSSTYVKKKAAIGASALAFAL